MRLTKQFFFASIALLLFASCSLAEQIGEKLFTDERMLKMATKATFSAPDIGTEFLYLEHNNGGRQNSQFFSPDQTESEANIHLSDSLLVNSNVQKMGTFHSKKELLSFIKKMSNQEYNFLGLHLIKSDKREVMAWQLFPKGQEVLPDRGARRQMRAARIESEVIATGAGRVAATQIRVRRFQEEDVIAKTLSKKEAEIVTKRIEKGAIVSLGSFRSNKTLWKTFKSLPEGYLDKSFDLYIFPKKNGEREVAIRVFVE